MSGRKNKDKKTRKGKATDFPIPASSKASSDINELTLTLQDLSIDNDKENLLQDLPKNVLYYGWFFSEKVSLLLKETADTYLNECFQNVEQFNRFLTSACESCEIRDFDSFYRKPGKRNKPSKELKYHVTAKFLDRKQDVEYAKMVQPFIGKIFKIHLVGFYFTKTTFGIRIKLTDAQKILFDERDGLDCSKCNEPVEHKINALSQLEDELSSYKLLSSIKYPKCKSLIHSNLSTSDKTINLIPIKLNNNFQPTTSRAHITVGCAPSIKAIQTGLDLLDIIDLEKRESSVFHQDYKIDGGTLRQFGRFGDAFVVYPCHEIVADATFNFFI